MAHCRALAEQAELQHVPLSVDTFYAEVAQQAVDAGAHMVNDVSGGLMDPRMHSQVSFMTLVCFCLKSWGSVGCSCMHT